MDNTDVIYEAIINTPGYLPTADEPAYFESAKAAWDYLRGERERDEDSADTEGEEYSETHATLSAIVEALDAQSEKLMREHGVADDGTGTLYGPTAGYEGSHDLGVAYNVVIIRHADYPHEPGRLYDCPACEAKCHCVEGYTQCIFTGEHSGEADEGTARHETLPA